MDDATADTRGRKGNNGREGDRFTPILEAFFALPQDLVVKEFAVVEELVQDFGKMRALVYHMQETTPGLRDMHAFMAVHAGHKQVSGDSLIDILNAADELSAQLAVHTKSIPSLDALLGLVRNQLDAHRTYLKSVDALVGLLRLPPGSLDLDAVAQQIRDLGTNIQTASDADSSEKSDFIWAKLIIGWFGDAFCQVGYTVPMGLSVGIKVGASVAVQASAGPSLTVVNIGTGVFCVIGTVLNGVASILDGIAESME